MSSRTTHVLPGNLIYNDAFANWQAFTTNFFLHNMPKAAPKLYNHSQRQTLAHQVASSSSSTSSGHHHVTYNTTSLDVPIPAPDPGDAMDIDESYPEHHHLDHLTPHQEEEVAELPSVKVTAKPRAKRYENSVTKFLEVCWFADSTSRMCLSTLGRNSAMIIWTNSRFWKARVSFSRCALDATSYFCSINAKIASLGHFGARSVLFRGMINPHCIGLRWLFSCHSCFWHMLMFLVCRCGIAFSSRRPRYMN